MMVDFSQVLVCLVYACLVLFFRFTLFDMRLHLVCNEIRSADHSQSPVLVLAYGHQDELFLKKIDLLGPSLDTLVTVFDRISTLSLRWETKSVAWTLRHFLKLRKELWIENVHFFSLRRWDGVILQEP